MFKKVVVIGSGFVGLSTSVFYAHSSYKTVNLDIDKEKVSCLQQGVIPFYEPNLSEKLFTVLKEKKLIFSSDYKASISDADIIVICVGTPSNECGSVNLTFLLDAVKSSLPYLKDGVIIAIKSTVPFGIVDRLKEILNQNKQLSKYHIALLPEFLREGRAVEDTFNPEFVLIGSEDKQTANLIRKLYREIEDSKILTVSPTSAQIIKYANNAHGAMRIVFTNELANICEYYGGDISEVCAGLPFSKTINDYPFYPGLGYGGSCFPKDVKALANLSEVFESDNLWAKIDSLNSSRAERIFTKVKKFCNGFEGKNVAVFGLSFKPNTSDQRDSPAKKVIHYLLSEGANVYSYDPCVSEIDDKSISESTNYCQLDSISECLKMADVIIPLIEWDEIINYQFEINKFARNTYFIDSRNQFNRQKIESSGFKYFGIGVQNS